MASGEFSKENRGACWRICYQRGETILTLWPEFPNQAAIFSVTSIGPQVNVSMRAALRSTIVNRISWSRIETVGAGPLQELKRYLSQTRRHQPCYWAN